MKFTDVFKGGFFKAADLKGKPARLTIANIQLEDVGDDRKPVARFEEAEQALVLNKTNAGVLADAYGDETDDWIGQVIIIKPDKTDYAGKRVDCIRVAIPTKKTPSPVVAEEETDDINV